MRHNRITSPTNQVIKDLVRLKERKGPRCDTSFLVEGRREIDRAHKSGFVLEDVFYCLELLSDESKGILFRLDSPRTTEVSKDVFSKIALRDKSDGLVAVFAIKEMGLENFTTSRKAEPPLIVVIENVEKPGNLGAILRTADGAGFHGVVVLGTKVDLWNPNVIRSSLGAIFSVPTVQCDYTSFFDWCLNNKITLIAAALREESQSIFEIDFSQGSAVILGSEASGLSDRLILKSSKKVVLPMLGVCDSLNVSVAAGILMYEARRQRGISCR